MDKPQNGNISRMDEYIMVPLEQNQEERSHDDILARRLKNRERQRRYRARKRHEADMKKALVVTEPTQMQYLQGTNENQSAIMQVEVPVALTTPDFLTRIHCRRDWKKDARTAHLLKLQDEKASTPVCAATKTSTASEAVSLPGRRHWKAEARNKRS